MDFSLLLRRMRTWSRDAPVLFRSVTAIRAGIFPGKKGFFSLSQSKSLPPSSSWVSVGFKVQINTRKCGDDKEGEESNIYI